MSQHLRKIWITSFTLVALLLSSVVTSAPLMSLKMLSMTHNTVLSNTHCADKKANIAAHDTHRVIAETCNQDAQGMDTCCSMACVSFFAYIPTQVSHLSQRSQLVKIPQDTNSQKSTYPHSLYRPPIA